MSTPDSPMKPYQDVYSDEEVLEKAARADVS